jgi:type IV secretory pathway TraG/TraD family ATPase VirD4
LLSIDEFPLLGRMESIIDNMNYIGESGVKLFLACQQIVNLKDIYGDNYDQFISGSALQIWFATGGTFTGEYLSKMLGETEIIKYQRNINTGQNVTNTQGTTATHSTTTGTSKGNSESSSTSESWLF